MNEQQLSQVSLKTHYERVVSRVQEDFEGVLEPVSAEFLNLLQRLDANGIALDLGYGFGQYAFAIAMRGFNVDAVDIIDATILEERARHAGIGDKIKVLEVDAKEFKPINSYDLVVAKDLLHYFPRQTVEALLGRLIIASNPGSVHYLEVFTDIMRQKNGISIRLDEEAGFRKQKLDELITDLYGGWNVGMMTAPYQEASYDKSQVEPYFTATKCTYICERS